MQQVDTGRTIRGFPLIMHLSIEPIDEDSFYVWNKIPLRTENRLSYRSPFAQRLREDGSNRIPFAYLQILVSRRQPTPIYIKEFFVFSNVLRHGAEADEQSKGLGKQMMCATLHYMMQQPWMRTYAISEHTNVYLMAGGGQATPVDEARIDALPLETCLHRFGIYTTNLMNILTTIWLEHLSPEEMAVSLLSSSVKMNDIKDQVETVMSNVMEEQEDEDDPMNVYMEAADQLSRLFEQDTVLLQYFLMEQNLLHPDWDIPKRVRYELVIIEDNAKLVHYYASTYGLKQDPATTDGQSVRMVGRIKDMLAGCKGKRFEGSRQRRKQLSNTRRSRK